jgi:hypothetical protein
VNVRAPTPSGGRLAAHLGSRDVARVIYGAVIGLALVVALEAHPPTATQAAGALLGTALAVALAEVYSEYVGAEVQQHRRLDRRQMRSLAGEAGAVAFGAAFPAIFFIGAAVGVLELDTAFTFAKWTGLGVLGAYGYVGARLAGSGRGSAAGHAAAVCAVGGLLILLKALLH